MKIIIDIPEEKYDWIMSHLTLDINFRECKITPLPKGHGRIADMDEAIRCIKDVEGEDAILAISLIEWACAKRTIIEADKS